MQDHPVPASGVKQNRLFGQPKLAVKYGSKEFREAKAKVPRKRKSLENVVFSRLFVAEGKGFEPLWAGAQTVFKTASL